MSKFASLLRKFVLWEREHVGFGHRINIRIIIASSLLISADWLSLKYAIGAHSWVTAIAFILWAIWMSAIAIFLFRYFWRDGLIGDEGEHWGSRAHQKQVQFALFLFAICMVPLYFFPDRWTEILVVAMVFFAISQLALFRLTDPGVEHRAMGLAIVFWSIGVFFFFGLSLIAMIDHRRGYLLFEATCDLQNNGLWAYLTFVVDCFAKGALIDLLDSYNINLYHCAPRKGDFINSTIVFALRSFSTYFVLWVVIVLWRRFRASRIGN